MKLTSMLLMACATWPSLEAAEGLIVRLRTGSMFTEPVRLKHYYGPCFNKKMQHWNGTGTMCVVIWLENSKGQLVKTIARWANNSGYKGKGPQGDFAGRAYDLVTWNGIARHRKNQLAVAYEKGASADPNGGTPPEGVKSANCYDSIMGPTVGAPVKGKPVNKHGDLLSTTDGGKSAWDFIDRHGNKLKPGKYVLCIEGVEWAEPFNGTIKFAKYSAKGIGAEFDYVKKIDVEYDGFSFVYDQAEFEKPIMSPVITNPNTNKPEPSKPVLFDFAIEYTAPFDASSMDDKARKDYMKMMEYVAQLKHEKSSKRKSAVKRIARYGALAAMVLEDLEALRSDENKYVVKEAEKAIEKIERALAEDKS